MRLVLASASPRRRELLAALGLRFHVAPSAVDEEALARGLPPVAGAERVARAKARAAGADAGIVLAADTIVVLDGQVLGKPATDAEARAMLGALAGRTHVVVTAVAVAGAAPERAAVVETDVRMRAYGDAEIAAWIATGGARDKAGAYAIQSETFRPVEAIGGCWCNVMGLPLWTAYAMLRDAGALAPRSPERAYARCAACPLARGAA